MFEMMTIGRYLPPVPGIKGTVYGRTQKTLTGNGMKMSADGKYVASGLATANSGAGAVYINDLRDLTNPVIKRSILLPEWKPGTTEGVYSRVGQTVRGSDDLRTVAANSQADGVDKGAIWVMTLDADHNVTDYEKVIPVGLGSGDYFGLNFDMNGAGDVLAIAAPGTASFTGRVYMYGRVNGTWTLEKTIDRPLGETCQRFGTPITLSRDGEYVVISGLPSALAGSSRVFIYKRNGGAWNLVNTITDTRAIGGAGRLSGYISGDGNKIGVTYSYHDGTGTKPPAGWDIYTFDKVTNTPTKIDTIPNGISGGGVGIAPTISYDGSTLLSAPALTNGVTFSGLLCTQLNPDTGKYANDWTFTTPDINQFPVYPVVSDSAKVWAAAVPNLLLQAKDSFFCGR